VKNSQGGHIDRKKNFAQVEDQGEFVRLTIHAKLRKPTERNKPVAHGRENSSERWRSLKRSNVKAFYHRTRSGEEGGGEGTKKKKAPHDLCGSLGAPFKADDKFYKEGHGRTRNSINKRKKNITTYEKRGGNIL